jgi:transcriptional regulator with XRE-family HTH domain
LVFKVKSIYASLVLDNAINDLYHIGMVESDNIKELREAAGRELQRFRESAGFDQTELANKVGTQQAQISRWEAGGRDIPIRMAKKLGHFFKCHPGRFRRDLLGDGVDGMLLDHPEIEQQVRDFAKYLIRKTDT